MCAVVPLITSRCLAPATGLDKIGQARFHDLTEVFLDHYDRVTLWDVFGIVDGVIVRALSLPRCHA